MEQAQGRILEGADGESEQVRCHRGSYVQPVLLRGNCLGSGTVVHSKSCLQVEQITNYTLEVVSPIKTPTSVVRRETASNRFSAAE